MSAKIIKQHIKSSKDQEVIFEVEKDSPILASDEGLKLIKKSGAAMGKKVSVRSTEEGLGVKVSKSSPRPLRGNTKPRFSDIVVPNRVTKPVVKPPAAALEEDGPVSRTVREEDGSRYEVEMVAGSRSSKFSKIFILCLIVLVFAVFGLAVLLPKADVTVFARSEPITRDFEVIVDKSVATANPATMEIPGLPVSKEVSQTKQFPTTGVKVSGTKAGGNVTIYNFTANTLKLRAATTTLIAGGKRYVLLSDVSGIKPNGAATAGVAIAATQPGEAYNLPAKTRFQIVNAALGDANVYAENPNALGGGTTGEQTKILSQADIDNATSSLIADVIAQAESDLTQANGIKIKLLDSAVKKEVLAKTANKEVGAATDSFNMTLIAKVTGMAFREDDVINVVVSKINEVLSSDKYLLEDKQKQYTANFKSIDLTKGSGVLQVHFETVAAYKIDAANLPKILAGKTEAEIKEILLSKSEVDNVTVKFWPEWFVHKAPKFNGKININTVLSQ
ncbi:MAG: baseplate J/gp47 family protein [Candidatus Doudnabacteria bacterium]|nr:baseplate J/gp47 family protein [Candidatus Doudnabacteria bacterium]